MEEHNYSVFITHGVLVQSDRVLTEDEVITMAIDILLTREREQLIGASDFEINKWEEGE
jgi:hypothetical protein